MRTAHEKKMGRRRWKRSEMGVTIRMAKKSMIQMGANSRLTWMLVYDGLMEAMMTFP